jgi:hypothetical protein
MFISFCTFAFGPPGRVDSLLKPHYVRWMVPRSRPCGSRLETQRDWSSLVNELFRLARLELKGAESQLGAWPFENRSMVTPWKKVRKPKSDCSFTQT